MSATAFIGTLSGRSTKVAAKLAMVGIATGTAAALALGPTAPTALADDPNPTSVDILQDVYTTGPLASILAGLGVASIGPIQVTDPPRRSSGRST